MEPFKIGDVIAGKYEITRVLGRGGRGVVVAARHRELGDEVALKFLQPSATDRPESHARFAREARTATRIKSEPVARVFDVGTADGAPFIVMECLTGEDLSRVIQRRGPLPAVEAVDLLLQACEALAEAHNLGIVHRDLKPANLFVTTRSDGTPCVKVLDFGISKSTSLDDVSVTASAAVVGSPLYMSPEQLVSSRNADARSDVWALGVVLYEMVTGKRPFSGESFATISAAILRGTFSPPSELCPVVPAPLEQVIAETLAHDPESRPPSVAAFAARIAPCGSEAARASCRRIERIAARIVPATEPGAGTVADGPPSAVMRARQAPEEVTLPPAPDRSVDTAERRPMPPSTKGAIVAGGVVLLASSVAVGLGLGGASPSAPPAVAKTATADASSADASAPSADAGPGWRAHLLSLQKTERLNDVVLGDFAVAAPPSGDHPAGVVAALGSRRGYDPGNNADSVFVVAIDLSDEHVLGDNWLGYAAPGTTIDIASTPRGVVVAKQQDKTFDLYWFTDGTIDADSRSIPALAGEAITQELRAFKTFDDRIVLATGGDKATTVWVLDAQGRLLTRHACHGGLAAPGDAELTLKGDEVLVTNFVMEEPDRVPLCAGRLHGPPLWREVTLHGGKLEVVSGGVYFAHEGGADQVWTKALDDNLQPTGLPPPPAKPYRSAICSGTTGAIPWHVEDIGGLTVIEMVSCCGESGGGLFVCGPPERGR